MVWRLVLEKVATLQDLETSWSLDDMQRAHTSLLIASEIEAISIEERNKK